MLLELQHNIKVWDSWFSNTVSLEFNHESALSWTKDC
jgi:hypothetical protein